MNFLIWNLEFRWKLPPPWRGPDLAGEIGNWKFRTAVATATQRTTTGPWENLSFLSNQEANGLRSESQVINLAFLSRGQALYNQKSIAFDTQIWRETTDVPLGISELTMNGTDYKIKVKNFEYYLNVYQPFVLDEQPNICFVVDSNSKIWILDAEQVKLVDVETAQLSLPVNIAPNPKLSPTY